MEGLVNVINIHVMVFLVIAFRLGDARNLHTVMQAKEGN